MTDTSVAEGIEEVIKVVEPKFYKVLLHNDDTTTFDFVIIVLVKLYHKTFDEAVEITKSIHEQGQGIAGAPYTREIAEEKTNETIALARANNFPLTPTFEEI
jgi:ATP-dependent Clp protease adaptor protein ClpS